MSSGQLPDFEMNILNDKKEKDLVKHFSFKDGFVNYDSADFRKDFDKFIENINIKTQKNLNENKEIKNEKDKDKENPNATSSSPTFNEGKNLDK